jgi:hypothetical protein
MPADPALRLRSDKRAWRDENTVADVDVPVAELTDTIAGPARTRVISAKSNARGRVGVRAVVVRATMGENTP